MRLAAAMILVLASEPSSFADEVDDLVAHGEQLAKSGELTQAIDMFKRADARLPTAKHACLIGLAYTRRELWAEAELFFALCRERATAHDPLPDWIDAAERQLTDKLAATNAAPITIEIRPADARAQISVSSFAPGELFPPRTIHLAPGTHLVTATAPGFELGKQEVKVEGTGPQRVTIVLRRLPPPPDPSRTDRLPLYVLIAGGALATAGVVYDEVALQPVRARFQSTSNYAYDQAVAQDTGTLETRRDITIGLFAGAAVTTTLAVILHYTLATPSDVPQVGVSVGHGGGGLSVEWHR